MLFRNVVIITTVCMFLLFKNIIFNCLILLSRDSIFNYCIDRKTLVNTVFCVKTDRTVSVVYRRKKWVTHLLFLRKKVDMPPLSFTCVSISWVRPRTSKFKLTLLVGIFWLGSFFCVTQTPAGILISSLRWRRKNLKQWTSLCPFGF